MREFKREDIVEGVKNFDGPRWDFSRLIKAIVTSTDTNSMTIKILEGCIKEHGVLKYNSIDGALCFAPRCFKLKTTFLYPIF